MYGFYAGLQVFWSSGKEESGKKKGGIWVKFGVNDYNISSYYPKAFRAISGLDHASERCVFNMTVIKPVGSCAHWEFIWSTCT